MRALVKITLVRVTVSIHHFTLPVYMSRFEVTVVVVAVRVCHGAPSLVRALLPRALVLVTARASIHHCALPAHPAILPLTDVRVTCYVDPGAASICTIAADTLANYNAAASKAN